MTQYGVGGGGGDRGVGTREVGRQENGFKVVGTAPGEIGKQIAILIIYGKLVHADRASRSFLALCAR